MHIKKLQITNFKSIRKLDLKTKRVNVFIGEPNSGKSNILEAMGFLSFNAMDEFLFKEIFRFDSIDELFPDSDMSEPMKIFTDDLKVSVEYHKNTQGALMNNVLVSYFRKSEEKEQSQYTINFDGKIGFYNNPKNFSTNVCYYSFRKQKEFRQHFRDFLNPPFGDNIPSLLLSNKELRNLIVDIFREKGFRFEIKPKETKISMVKDIDGALYSYSYHSISETLQRIVFMLLAIESNKNMVLLFDEPEANTFPFYTKYIAERIALDKTNQYFLTTHNPYLLSSIIEKTPAKDLNVVVTKMKKYETQCTPLNQKQVERAIKMGFDVFFNIDKLAK